MCDLIKPLNYIQGTLNRQGKCRHTNEYPFFRFFKLAVGIEKKNVLFLKKQPILVGNHSYPAFCKFFFNFNDDAYLYDCDWNGKANKVGIGVIRQGPLSIDLDRRVDGVDEHLHVVDQLLAHFDGALARAERGASVHNWTSARVWNGNSSDDSKDTAFETLSGLVGHEGQLSGHGFALGDLAAVVHAGVAVGHRHGDNFAAG